MDNNTLVEQTTESAVETAIVSTTKNGKKSGYVIGGVTVLTLGAAYGVYRLIKRHKKKKAAKSNNTNSGNK